MAIGERVVGDDIAAALERSHFRDLPGDVADELVSGARRIRVPAGSTVRGAGETGAHVELLVEGFVRIFLTAPDGRSLTVRYFRHGALTGVASLFTPKFSMPGSIQALVDSEILAFRPDVVIGLAERDIRVARALIDELSERVVSFVAEIPGSAFSTVRQRVARHLLDLASEQQQGQQLVAKVSQQALADAAGSVREVVVRVLRELREEGVIRTSRAGITILVPERLVVELFPAVTAMADSPDWNLRPDTRDSG
jgi:CRP/FNR family transcriptional regulator, cyclic AMP receptor protein